MAFTTYQLATIQGWRGKGYRILSQTLQYDHSYDMVIGRSNGVPVYIKLQPNGRFVKDHERSRRERL